MSKPLYLQIFEEYRKLIILNIFKPGDKLPSVRDVAFERGINPHTVNRAYLMLEDEGYVETIFKKGSFVKKINSENKITTELYKDIKRYQKEGISYKKILDIIKKVYGEHNDWS